MKELIRRTPLFVLAAILFGLKTYLVYRFMFGISIDSALQELILILNPLVSAYVIFVISIWLKTNKQGRYLKYSSLLATLVLYVNLLFYRNFTDFITLPVLFQGNNAADLTSSIFTLIHFTDLLLFLDVILIWILSRNPGWPAISEKPQKVAATAVMFLLLAMNVTLAEVERPMLFTRTFDREYLVKNIGLFNYHIYDLTMQTRTQAQRVFADGSEIEKIRNYIADQKGEESSKTELFGIAEDKNVVLVSVESMQNFVLDKEVNGEEITPFMNDLKENKDTLWFKNFYHQTAQGKTSDSEFLVENSLYPLDRGAVYFTHAQNDYNALPELLNEKGYTTSVFHANNESFWNRDVMYDNIGYDHFYSKEDFEIKEENSFGWGLEDKAFFEQSIPYLKEQEQPFYSKFITLTHHFPFDLPEDKASIDKLDTNSTTLNQYVQTARYTDESLKEFMNRMKEKGMYEDTMFIFMGDHYGISEFHKGAMSDYLGRDINGYEHIQLQRVPLMIHIPGSGEGKIYEKIAGQIDMKPTILHLLGIEEKRDINFGENMLAEHRKDFIAMRDGSFITKDYIYSKSVCYDKETGEPVELPPEEESPCEPFKEKVSKELEYSDNIIYGDLFRFYDFKD
ncbi:MULTISPECIES: LTA synthase family protein [Salimicrobium]|uniref:Phosphoglycerol transferase MdoB n=2 Tax=Salimicrobium TaxID=351195 RepID=A0ABY1KR32_9BACI|nr:MULTISPECIES: LTA synthase family protein [Salimicrobium]SDX69029.1 Phosphoglycerol transferase MdoB [Salimicrobium album]SIS53399.1 Phosphoglycerol transferase MdoB [Salimicrobium salexigens]